jgi:hypothetical protein
VIVLPCSAGKVRPRRLLRRRGHFEKHFLRLTMPTIAANAKKWSHGPCPTGPVGDRPTAAFIAEVLGETDIELGKEEWATIAALERTAHRNKSNLNIHNWALREAFHLHNGSATLSSFRERLAAAAGNPKASGNPIGAERRALEAKIATVDAQLAKARTGAAAKGVALSPAQSTSAADGEMSDARRAELLGHTELGRRILKDSAKSSSPAVPAPQMEPARRAPSVDEDNTPISAARRRELLGCTSLGSAILRSEQTA